MGLKEFAIGMGRMIATAAIMAHEPIRTKYYNVKESIAIRGYDPVEYF